jgi:two-component system phosphate regulon sensor histidine kinase PhoR
MESKTTARITRRGRSLSLTGVIVALSVGVLLPVMLSTAVGIVTLALGESTKWIVVGVLVVSFAAAAIGSAVTATILLSKKARTARLQADLLANVTHDLRTPLTAIRMYAQTLQDGRLKDDPKKAEESLETIVRETEWLETMIDRVLTWRAATKDRSSLQMQARPVREAVEVAVERFSRMLAPGEVDLAIKIDSVAPVNHDQHGISTVVLNLLINAYKYTRQDKQISVGVKDQDGQVVISVEDNGIGIAAKEVLLVFDPFYRVDTRLRGESTGAGLGLAIVRHLVKTHKGEVLVESREGQGSSFSVLLPRDKAS